MRVFVHTSNKEGPALADHPASSPVAVLADVDGPEAIIWLQDGDEPLDTDQSLEAAGVSEGAHLHVGTCRHVQVVVRFADDSYELTLGPGVTVHALFQRVTGSKFADLSRDQQALHGLVEPGGDHFLDGGVHVGSLADDACSVTLDLSPRDRFAG